MPKILTLVFCAWLAAITAEAQLVAPSQLVVGLGDSLGEGVQSADAAYQTQIHGYLPLIAAQMGVLFPLPLIKTGLFGVVGNVNGRSRLNPSALSADLAVSGANSTSILYLRRTLRSRLRPILSFRPEREARYPSPNR